MWWKRHKRKVILSAAAAVLLAAAFWFGGNAPGLQGWTAGGDTASAPAPEVQTALPAPAPDRTAAPAPADTPAPEPEAQPTPGPAAGPEESPAAGSSPEPEASPAPAADPEDGEARSSAAPEPGGESLPAEIQDTEVPDGACTCTLSISCAAILDNLDWLDPDKAELVPGDGVILPQTAVTFYAGESVFDVLQRTCKQNRIHMEFSMTPMYNSAYIEGIGNLYEFDCGEQSGWIYAVNGSFPNYGCSNYQLQDGDAVEFVYTCSRGADAGGVQA